MRAVAVLTPLVLLGVVLWIFLAGDKPERARNETVEAPRARSAQATRGDIRPAMRIGGVVHSAGEPYEGARVEVWNDARHASLAECVTDAQGRFAVEVPAGKVLVVALGPQCAPAVQRVELATNRLRLELVGGVISRGELVNGAGEPIVGAHIEVHRSIPPIRLVTDEHGHFDTPPLDPRYAHTLIARGDGYATRRFSQVLSGAARRRYVLPTGTSLSGTVRDARGEPLADVLLRLYCNPNELEARSDAEGRYRIDGVPVGFPGKLTLEPRDRLPQPCMLPIRYARAGAALDFDPVVVDGVTVSGVARAGTTVVLMRFTNGQLLKRSGTARCDASGAFVFSGVAPGTYLLHPYSRSTPRQHTRDNTATDRLVIHVGDANLTGLRIEVPASGNLLVEVSPKHEGKSVRVRARMELYGRVDSEGRARFDGLPSVSRAYAWFEGMREEFGIVAGESTTIAFGDPPEPRAVVAGVVVTPAGRPLSGAKVVLRNEHDTSFSWNAPSTVTDVDGEFELALGQKQIAQSWVALATHPDHVAGFVRGLEIAAGATPRVRLTMRRGLVLEGTVVDSRGRPCANTVVRMGSDPDDDRWSSSLRDRPSLAQRLDRDELLPNLQARTDARGRFRFTRCTSAECYVRAYGQNARSDDVSVKPGGEPVRLVLGNAELLTIGGIVLDEAGQPVHAAYISIVGSDINASTWREGRFTLEGVPPGKHSVEIGPRWGFDRPRFGDRIIENVEAGTLDLIVRVEPGPTLRGRVVDADGKSIPRPEVVLLAKPDSGSSFPMGTSKGDAEGEFEVRGIDADAFELAVFARGYLPRVFPIRIGTAECRLERGLSLGGRILTADGKPAPHRWVRFQLRKPADESQVVPWKRKGQIYLPYFGAKSDEEGRFVCAGLPAGEYELTEPKDVPAVTVGAGDTGIELRQRALLVVSGNVVDENGQPTVSDGKERLSIVAEFGGRYVGSTKLEDDGSFRIEGVPQGRVTLRVNGFPRFKSITVAVPAGSENVRIQLEVGQFRDRK